ncbi:hypothetical protein DFH11DRAFT_1589823 [Phellopilus nigrolimitatus]|nr:hypothetical protein DFH11DRAFT_1589823 [Phellopilus nigrolimitatus]
MFPTMQLIFIFLYYVACSHGLCDAMLTLLCPWRYLFFATYVADSIKPRPPTGLAHTLQTPTPTIVKSALQASLQIL